MTNTPVSFPFSQLIAAGATFDALTTWKYETPDRACMVELFERATAVGLLSRFSSAGQDIKQDSNVQSGGTAGVTPSRLNTDPYTGDAPANQKLSAFYRNPTGGGITVDGLVNLIPRGGNGGGGGGKRRVFRRKRK